VQAGQWMTKLRGDGMQVLAWISKHIVAPLGLFLVGALARYLFGGGTGRQIFDPAELSFAMSMLCLLVILSAAKLRDKQLMSSLVYGFALAMILFVSLFAWASMLEVQIETAVDQSLATLGKSLQGAGLDPALVGGALEEGICASEKAAVERLRNFALVLSVLTVTFALACKVKFKLED
jgi:hypothetical protein